jgi:hypothetical protein
MKLNNKFEGKKKKLAGITVAVALLVGTIIASLAIAAAVSGSGGGPFGDGSSSSSFGNATLSGQWAAEAALMEPDGGITGDGDISTSSSGTPEVLFEDDFESGNLSAWDEVDDVTVTSSDSQEGNCSAEIDPEWWTRAELGKDDCIELGEGDALNLYFSVKLSEGFEVNMGGVCSQCIDDYLVAKLEFDGGSTLTYLIGGAYTPGFDEEVVDLRSEAEETGDWVGLEIEDIQDDYKAQFGSEMPSSGDLYFEGRSMDRKAFLDSVVLKRTPETTRGNYWVLGETEVESFFVTAAYRVNISDEINSTNVWLEVKLWYTVYRNGGKVKDRTFMQDALINVTTFGAWENWTSAVFPLPEDEGDYGEELTYEFDIHAEIFGQIKLNETYGAGEWVSAEDSSEGFDAFTVEWITYDDYLSIVVGGALSALGITGLVAGGYKLKKSRESDECSCLGEPDCECAI